MSEHYNTLLNHSPRNGQRLRALLQARQSKEQQPSQCPCHSQYHVPGSFSISFSMPPFHPDVMPVSLRPVNVGWIPVDRYF